MRLIPMASTPSTSGSMSSTISRIDMKPPLACFVVNIASPSSNFSSKEASVLPRNLVDPRNQGSSDGRLQERSSHGHSHHNRQCGNSYPAVFYRGNRRHLRQDVSEQRQDLDRVNSNEVRNTQIARDGAPVDKGKPGTAVRRSHRV